MFTIKSASTGRCLLCVGKTADKDKPVFAVTSAGFSGQVCGVHMHALVQQAPQEAKPVEATLFQA